MPVNIVQLTGNILAPEVRQTKTGKTLAKAQMVVKTYGEDTDDMWVEVEAWENLANNLVSSFPTDRKTMRVIVEGTLKKDVWDDANTGQKRSRYFVSANNIAIAVGVAAQVDQAYELGVVQTGAQVNAQSVQGDA